MHIVYLGEENVSRLLAGFASILASILRASARQGSLDRSSLVREIRNVSRGTTGKEPLAGQRSAQDDVLGNRA